MNDEMPIELRIPNHLTIKTYSSHHYYDSVTMRMSVREDAHTWLYERLGHVPEMYLTGDQDGNWYYAMALSPEDAVIAVEFRLTWS